MKKTFLLLLLLSLKQLNAQTNPTDSIKSQKEFVITKNDGVKYIGVVVSDDGRELLIDTKTIGKFYLKKSEIKSIVEVGVPSLVANGEYQPNGSFTTRYILTNNALPIKKGDNYARVNLLGPEVHFAVNNRLNIGVMMTWIASPFALVMKYSFKTKKPKVNFSLGTLFATSGYLNNFSGYGGLHWGSMTIGSIKNNMTFSAGYTYLQLGTGTDNPNEGIYYNTRPSTLSNKLKPLTHGPVLSIAGIYKVGVKASLVFDCMLGLFNITYIKQEETELTPYVPASSTQTSVERTYYVSVTKKEYLTTILYIMPGIRWQHNDRKAFQVSFGGVSVNSDFRNYSFPLPTCSFFRKF